MNIQRYAFPLAVAASIFSGGLVYHFYDEPRQMRSVHTITRSVNGQTLTSITTTNRTELHVLPGSDRWTVLPDGKIIAPRQTSTNKENLW